MPTYGLFVWAVPLPPGRGLSPICQFDAASYPGALVIGDMLLKGLDVKWEVRLLLSSPVLNFPAEAERHHYFIRITGVKTGKVNYYVAWEDSDAAAWSRALAIAGDTFPSGCHQHHWQVDTVKKLLTREGIYSSLIDVPNPALKLKP